MERLTYDFCVGSVHCNQVRGADNLECGEVCQRQDDDGCATCTIARAFDRLAAIEDILGDEYDLDRLRELVQANREGDILRRNTPMSIYPDDDSSVEACPTCSSGEYLYNDDGDICRYCGQCGQRLDWTNDFYDRFFARLGEGNGNE